ncbi:pre-rRNA-processing protein TSR1 homolog [Lepeophtheirus salmonis]|uniref:Pre-rRNA-processing protein TSR1 homolog n=1 Tax=Lepeophtheirus salmonis TaxID=72036 RepID=A0A0K2UN89_LEPSM|nr:pre-rRNA-processing protein TSR1 homolog [Lepeophtheirus salmonis]
MQEVHRAGLLKQSNKSHKTGKHRSKGAVDTANRGRIGLKCPLNRKKADKIEGRLDRKHRLQQVRATKREAALSQKRSLGCDGFPPVLTGILSTSPGILSELITLIKNIDDSVVKPSPAGLTHVSFPRFKQRFVFFQVEDSLYSVIDAGKVVDQFMFVLDATVHDPLASLENKLLSLISQGLPYEPVFLLHFPFGKPDLKSLNECKKNLIKTVEKTYPFLTQFRQNLFISTNESEATLLLRHLGSSKRKKNHLRERRPHMVGEEVDYTEGMVKVTGYVRCADLNRRWSVNRLVHIPGVGDFQLEKIDSAVDPYPLAKEKRRDVMDDEEHEIVTLATADPSIQQSLLSENEPDPMDAEQTWPTEEELEEAEKNQKKMIKKTVPKGTSDYQASWIIDEEVEESENDEEEDMMDSDKDNNDLSVPFEHEGEEADQDDCEENDEEYETLEINPESQQGVAYDEKNVDVNEERDTFKKIQDARMDAMFPDEIDTPVDKLAKVRFQRYRGLKSFRTSPWDPKENLPYDYARIFQFENFDRTKKKVLSPSGDDEIEGIEMGWYVSMYIRGVSEDTWKSKIEGRPLYVFSLLPHENKMSIINIVVKKTPASRGVVVKSKEPIIVHVGTRRFCVNPIFSQHTNGSKHKYERFWNTDGAVVMTMFAPITFPPSPVLVFKPGQEELLGTGSLLSADPNRLVIKRAVLSGHPFKVNKRSCVVRFMFFNRSDIEWFKPIELKTKTGRRGHIKEALGTHGHMKCFFDAQLSQQDTVLMTLYKRVFPKWTYNPDLSNIEESSMSIDKDEFYTGSETLQLSKKKTPSAIDIDVNMVE